MKYEPETAEEREDLIREIARMLRRLNVRQLQRVAWYINDKWGNRV